MGRKKKTVLSDENRSKGNRSGQTLVSMLISSAIGVVVLLAMTDILNYLNRSQKTGEMTMEFTLWKSTISNLIRNQDQCSVAFSGNRIYTTPYNASNPTCDAGEEAVIHWPAGCSNPTYVNEVDCTAAGATWKATPWLKKSSVNLGKGLDITQICLKRVGTQELGNGPNYNDRVQNALLIVKAQKTSSQSANRTMEAFVPVTLTTDTSNIVRNCNKSHDKWSVLALPSLPSTVVNVIASFGAVWTGSEAIFFIGAATGAAGYRYNPVTEVVTPISIAGALDEAGAAFFPRINFSAVWTGSQVVLWGGRQLISGSWVTSDSGVRYDPMSNTWSPIRSHQPARRSHDVVWTGAKMIVWGGVDVAEGPAIDSGAAYDPVNNSWADLNTTDPDAAERRRNGTTIWVGGKMMIQNGKSLYDVPSTKYYTDTKFYDPTNLSDPWTVGAAEGGVRSHNGYTKSELSNKVYVDRGNGAPFSGNYKVYDFDTNTWSELESTNGPDRTSFQWAGYSVAYQNLILFPQYLGTKVIFSIFNPDKPVNHKWSESTVHNSPDVTGDRGFVYWKIIKAKNRILTFTPLPGAPIVGVYTPAQQ